MGVRAREPDISDDNARPETVLSTAKSSLTHALQIAEVAAPRGGMIGVTFCPGKYQADAETGAWARDLDLDLDAICAWGAGVVITLVTDRELADLRVAGLGAAVRARGIAWLHLPITDVSTPTAAWEADWARERSVVHAELDRGGKVLVHCKGGLGRAGTIAARILIERGMAPDAAIAEVRRRRGPKAIETTAQESYVRAVGKAHRVVQEAQDARSRPRCVAEHDPPPTR